MILFKNEIIEKQIGDITLKIQQPNNKQRLDLSTILIGSNEYKWIEAAEYVFRHNVKDIIGLYDTNGDLVDYKSITPDELAMGLSNVIDIVDAVISLTKVPEDIKKN